jgi:hypothetical protein
LRPSPSPSPLTEGRGTRGARGEGSRHLVKLYNEFHALIVRLAKEICVNHNPKCEICPVRDICKFGMQPSPALRAPSPQGERAGHGLPSPFREKVAAGRMRGRSPQ